MHTFPSRYIHMNSETIVENHIPLILLDQEKFPPPLSVNGLL